jgi:hypothetical protein
MFAPMSITVSPSRTNQRINATSDSLYCPYRSKHLPMQGTWKSIQPYLQDLSVSEPNFMEVSVLLL